MEEAKKNVKKAELRIVEEAKKQIELEAKKSEKSEEAKKLSENKLNVKKAETRKQLTLLLDFENRKTKLNANLSLSELKNEISSTYAEIPSNKIILQVFDEEFNEFVDVNSIDLVPEKGKITISLQSQFYFGKISSIVVNSPPPTPTTLKTTTTTSIPNPIRQSLHQDIGYKGVLDVLKNFAPKKSCKEFVLELGKTQGMEQFPFIATECETWLEDHLFTGNPNGLTKDELFAVGMYTWDLGLNGSKEENFYFILNNILRVRKTVILTEWRGYLYYLQSALKKFPNKKVTVFRGIPDVDFIKGVYKIGRKIHWSGYSSSTTKLPTAKSFAGSTGVIMKVAIHNGKDIQSCSPFPVEDEIVLSPNMKLFVSREIYQEDGFFFIDLIQEAVDDTFVF